MSLFERKGVLALDGKLKYIPFVIIKPAHIVSNKMIIITAWALDNDDTLCVRLLADKSWRSFLTHITSESYLHFLGFYLSKWLRCVSFTWKCPTKRCIQTVQISQSDVVAVKLWHGRPWPKNILSLQWNIHSALWPTTRTRRPSLNKKFRDSICFFYIPSRSNVSLPIKAWSLVQNFSQHSTRRHCYCIMAWLYCPYYVIVETRLIKDA